MAGESWESHKNTASERDMYADHEAQSPEYEQDIPAVTGVDWPRTAPGRSPWDKPTRPFSETPGGLTPFERDRMDRQAVEIYLELADDLAREREEEQQRGHAADRDVCVAAGGSAGPPGR